MKNLFNDISQDEKNRILEMRSGKKNVISEQETNEAGYDDIKKMVNMKKNIHSKANKVDETLSRFVK